MGRNKKLFSVGIAGTVIAALCCFTPVFLRWWAIWTMCCCPRWPFSWG